MSQNIEQYYDDGTEPTILRRLPAGCDQQGRYPQAAESATEVGTDDDFAEDYTAMLTDISVAIVVIMVIGIIALLALGKV